MVAPEPARRAPIRAMLADESEASRLLLGAMLGADARFELVGAVDSGAQLTAHSDHVDLVIVDLVLADTDAFTAIGRLHERDPGLPIVVFASVDPPYLRAEAEADVETVLDGFADAARLTKAD